VATTIDLGDAKNIHPRDKEPIGKRLALLAARDVNGQAIAAQGPTFSGMLVDGSTVVISFSEAKGLKTSDGAAPAQFWLAGEDRKWHRATAEIQGETVLLRAKPVSAPVAVRYAFAGFPKVNLINDAGLPVYPFRSDTWAR
jgi:sialate O-acetylesterase